MSSFPNKFSTYLYATLFIDIEIPTILNFLCEIILMCDTTKWRQRFQNSTIHNWYLRDYNLHNVWICVGGGLADSRLRKENICVQILVEVVKQKQFSCFFTYIIHYIYLVLQWKYIFPAHNTTIGRLVWSEYYLCMFMEHLKATVCFWWFICCCSSLRVYTWQTNIYIKYKKMKQFWR